MKHDLSDLQARYGRHYRTYLLGVLVLGSMVMILSSTSINVALPAIMHEFSMGRPLAQWLSMGFLASMISGLLLASWVQVRFGARFTVQLSIGLFMLCSVLAMAATSGWQLIVLRILQGACAGIIQPLATVLIFRVYADGRRGKAMGLYGLGLMLAPSIGPSIGGYLVDHFGWMSAFWLPLPICILVLFAGYWLLPRERTDKTKPFDITAFALLNLVLFCALAVFADIQRMSWTEPQVIFLALLSLLAGLVFLKRSLGNPQAILQLQLWRYAEFRYASWLALVLGLGLYGSIYLIPLFLQTIHHYSAGRAGILLLPAGLVLGIASFASGWLSDRIPVAWLLMLGLLLFAAFALGFGLLPISGFMFLCVLASLGRAGLGFIMPALTSASLTGLEAEALPYGAGLITFVRQLGGAFGINLLTAFLEWQHVRLGNNLAAEALAFERTFILLGILFLIALWPAWQLHRCASRM